MDEAGWWCQDNATICPLIWWCGVRGIVVYSCLGIFFWACLFAVLCFLLQPLADEINRRWPSKIEDEHQVSWLALSVQSTFHAGLVSWMASGAIWNLSGADPRVQLDAPSIALISNYAFSAARIANGAHIFFCYIVVDTAVTFWRKSMTVDYFIHHCVFISFCVMIQYDCFAAYLAGWLLLMEVSTVFLNGFIYWRNRLGYDHPVVKVFFVLFGISFFTFRLAGTSYIALYWAKIVLHGSVPFVGIPQWHLYVLAVALVGAVVLQIVWAHGIAKKLLKVFIAPQEKVGDAEGGSDEEGHSKDSSNGSSKGNHAKGDYVKVGNSPDRSGYSQGDFHTCVALEA